MHAAVDTLPLSLQMAAAAGFIANVIWAAWRAPWRRLSAPAEQHRWFGATTAAVLLWRLDPGTVPALDVHLLGAAALVLLFGPQLALISLCLALMVAALTSGEGLAFVGLKGLLAVVVPVAASVAIVRLARRLLPAHPLGRAFGQGFIAGAVAPLTGGLALLGTLGILDVYPMASLRQYFPYLFLLSWSEAALTGLVLFLLALDRFPPGEH